MTEPKRDFCRIFFFRATRCWHNFGSIIFETYFTMPNRHTSPPKEENVTSIPFSPSSPPSTFPSSYPSATSEVPTTPPNPTVSPSFYPSFSPSRNPGTPIPTPMPVLITPPSMFPSFYPSATSEIPTTSLNPTATPSFYSSFSPSRTPVPTSMPSDSIYPTGNPSFRSSQTSMPSDTPLPSMTMYEKCPNVTIFTSPVDPNPIIASGGFLIAVGCIALIPVILYFCLSFQVELGKFLLCRCSRNDMISYYNMLPKKRDLYCAMLVAAMSGFILFSKVQDEFGKAKFIIFWVPITFFFLQLGEVWKEYRKSFTTVVSLPEAENIKANNIFEEPTKTFYSSLLVGTAQVLLIMLYVGGIWKREDVQILQNSACNYESDSNCVKRSEYIGYYSFAVFIGLAYVWGTDKWTSLRMSAKYWGQGFKKMQRERDSTDTHTSELWNKGKLEIWYRFLYGTVIHSAGLTFILMVLPIHVAVGDPQPDPVVFVLNVVAVFFIIELDERFRSPPPKDGVDEDDNNTAENDEESLVPRQPVLDSPEGHVQRTNTVQEATPNTTLEEAEQFKDRSIFRKGTVDTEDQYNPPSEDEDDLECMSINSYAKVSRE